MNPSPLTLLQDESWIVVKTINVISLNDVQHFRAAGLLGVGDLA